MDFNFIDKSNIVLDLETLGTGAKSPILQIGAAHLYTGKVLSTFSCFPEVQPQIDRGAEVSWSTVLWWFNPDLAEARKIQYSAARIPVEESLHGFSAWLQQQVPKFFEGKQPLAFHWGNAPSFDQRILENMYKAFGIKYQLPHNLEQDLRTLTQVTSSYSNKGI